VNKNYEKHIIALWYCLVNILLLIKFTPAHSHMIYMCSLICAIYSSILNSTHMLLPGCGWRKIINLATLSLKFHSISVQWVGKLIKRIFLCDKTEQKKNWLRIFYQMSVKNSLRACKDWKLLLFFIQSKK
jgi:hypothetical protein